MSEEILGRRTQRVSEEREGIGNRNQPGIGMGIGIGVGEDHAQAEMACGSKEQKAPFPVSPTGESRGGRVPPTPQHAASQPKALSRIDAGGSPRKRDFKALSLKSPLRIPLLACGSKEGCFFLFFRSATVDRARPSHGSRDLPAHPYLRNRRHLR
jgi:hypothetical protein